MRASILALTLGASAATARQFNYHSDGKPLNKRIAARPNDFWDHIVRGADVAEAKVSSTSAETSSLLANFNLRAKEVDPSSLKVDAVKQLSGYLDNDEQDKHLFYCKQCTMTR